MDRTGHVAASAPLSPVLALRPQFLQLALEPCDAIPRATPIDLELCFARAPTTDPTLEPGQRHVGALCESRQPVFELRQFDLEFAVAGCRVLREDVEDELRAIDDTQLHALGQVAGLCGGQILVDDDELDAALEGSNHQILQLAGAEDGLGVDAGALLGDDVDDLDTRRPRQLTQLGDVGVEVVGGATRRDRHEDRTLAVPDLARADRARELLLEVVDPGLEVEVDLCGWPGIEEFQTLAIVGGRSEGGGVGTCRQPVVVDADRDHGVEAEQEQVRLVVPGQTFAREVCVDATQTAQPATTGTQTTPIGQLDRVGGAHHHVLHVAAPVDQHADLPPGVPTDLGQLPRELLRQQGVGGDAAPEEALEPANLVRLEPAGVAEDLCQFPLSRAKRRYTSRGLVELCEHVRPFLLGAPARPGIGHLLELVDPSQSVVGRRTAADRLVCDLEPDRVGERLDVGDIHRVSVGGGALGS